MDLSGIDFKIKLAIASCPFLQARCKAVSPFESVKSKSHLRSINVSESKKKKEGFVLTGKRKRNTRCPNKF